MSWNFATPAFILLTALSATCFEPGALAQAVLPGPAQPGLLDRRFESPSLPKSGGEAIVTPETAGTIAPPGAEKATFVLREVVIEGATVFSPEELKPLYDQRLGTTVSVGTLYGLAQSITSKYTAAGYLLSQAVVPPQKITAGGIIRLRVVEGYVDQVILQGDIQGPRRLLEAYGDRIKAARPLTLAVLERYLLLAGDLPGVTASGTLKPSANVPGAADLIFEVTHKSVDASASLDNRGSRYVGPWQMSATTRLNSVFGLYEKTSLQVAATPLDLGELKYGRISHEESIDDEGTKLSVDAGYADSHPGWSLKPEALRSHVLTFGVGLNTPLIRSRSENLTLSGRVESNDTVTDVYEDQLVFRDRVRVFRGGGSYDWVDTALVTPAVSMIALEFSQGIDALNATRPGTAKLTRSNGHSDFFKITLDASRMQRLYPGISLLTALSSQWAGASLLSSEQFSFGGSQFGRGLDPGEIVGDHGLAGRAELQYLGPEVSMVDDWRIYLFSDIAQTWRINPLAHEHKSDAGVSSGLGVRANVTESLSLNVELAKPIVCTVAGCEATSRDVRAFLGVIVRY